MGRACHSENVQVFGVGPWSGSWLDSVQCGGHSPELDISHACRLGGGTAPEQWGQGSIVMLVLGWEVEGLILFFSMGISCFPSSIFLSMLFVFFLYCSKRQ